MRYAHARNARGNHEHLDEEPNPFRDRNLLGPANQFRSISCLCLDPRNRLQYTVLGQSNADTVMLSDDSAHLLCRLGSPWRFPQIH